MRRWGAWWVLAGLGLASCSTQAGGSLAVTERGDQPIAIVDNCPAVQQVSLEVAGQTVWSIERITAAPETATIDVALGTTPAGWQSAVTLAQPLRDDTRYVVRVGPEPDTVEFGLSDLVPGQAFDGSSGSSIGARSTLVTCADVDGGGIDSLGDLLFTSLLLLVLGAAAFGLVAWGLIKILQRLVGPRHDDVF